MSLAKRHALVTGSTSGIGLAIARALAKEGVDVVINGFGDKAAIEGERVKIEKEFGVKAFYNAADMSKGAEIEAMIVDAQSKMGSLDILVNNAGIQFVSPIEEFPPEKWDAIIAINLSSAFHAIRAAVPGMKAQKWGRIINTASAHSLVASPFKSAYVSAKHGLAGLTKTVALELATFGVTANCISPGYVWTPLVENQIPDTMKARNMTREQVIKDVMLARPADQGVRHRRSGRFARGLSLLGRSGADHRRQSVDRRRMDRRVSRSPTAAPNPSAQVKTVNLALQGGGSHGAYTWGVLDALAEDARIEISAISGSSAGAMNAVVFASGTERGRKRRRPREAGEILALDLVGGVTHGFRAQVGRQAFRPGAAFWPGARWIDAWTEAVSGIHEPLRVQSAQHQSARGPSRAAVDFERLRASDDLKLFIAATNVKTGHGEIFRRDILTADHAMASACVPQLFQAVIINGEPYWDGGYAGNPPLWPLFYETQCRDAIIVQINPIERAEIPRTPGEIADRGRRNHLQRQPSGRTSRRRLRRPPHQFRRAEERRIPA